jgi:hypothetical protein
LFFELRTKSSHCRIVHCKLRGHCTVNGRLPSTVAVAGSGGTAALQADLLPGLAEIVRQARERAIAVAAKPIVEHRAPQARRVPEHE